MAGNRRSGRRPLGESILADALHEHLRRGADVMRSDGLTADEVAWIEGCQALVTQQEMVRSKTTLARALLEGDDVTHACRVLFGEHLEMFGSPVRLAGAA